MTDASFSPFQTHLDQDRALKILRAALDGAEDGELFIERSRGEALVFDDGRLRNASYDAEQGFGLRAVRGEVTGYAHSTEINEAALKKAAETVRLAVGDGGGTLALPPAGQITPLYAAIDPAAGVSFAGRVALLREIDAFARDLDPRVVQVSASISTSVQEIAILRPEGGWPPISARWRGSISRSSWN